MKKFLFLFYFFSEIELMSDVWQREKKKSLELNTAVGICWCWWAAAGGLGKKFNGVF